MGDTPASKASPDADGSPSGPLAPPPPAPVLDEKNNPPIVPLDYRKVHLLQLQPVRDLLVVGLIVFVFYLGYVLRSVTIPVLLALTLAYLFEPVVNRVTRSGRVKRSWAAAGVIVVVVLAFVVPVSLGIGFATMQGINYGKGLQSNLSVLRQSLAMPERKDLDDKLRAGGRSWVFAKKLIQGIEKEAPAEKAKTDAKIQIKAAAEVKKEIEKQNNPSDPTAPESGEASPVAAPDPAMQPMPTRSPNEVLPPDFDRAASKNTDASGEPVTARGLADRALGWTTAALERNSEALGQMLGKEFLGTGADAVHLVWRLIKGSAYLLFSAFLVLFFFFFFCISYENVLRRLTNMIPKWKRTRVLSQVQMMDRVIAGFVRGRLTIMLILMVSFTIGYLIIGVPAALIVGPIVGLLAIVPYLGLVSIPLSMGLMALNPGGFFEFQQAWWWIVFAPIGLYALIQGTDDYVLNPLIQGKATEMDTPSILFAVLAGGVLAGFYGVLLAIPAAACIKIVLRESFWPRFEAWADGKVKDFLPISKYDPTETRTAPTVNANDSQPVAQAGPQVGPAPTSSAS